VDDKLCVPNISGSRYVVRNQNDHTPGIIVGYCPFLADGNKRIGLAEGSHSLKISVRGNSADCFTGWDRQSQGSFMMEAIELEAGAVSGVVVSKARGVNQEDPFAG